jgi:hypothetical protein
MKKQAFFGCLVVLLLCVIQIGSSGAAIALTPTLTPTASDEAQIRALLDNMQNAVLQADKTTYLLYIDQSDPVFALEHSRWADDWVEPNKVSRYELQTKDLEIKGDTATATLSVSWDLATGGFVHVATFPVQFSRNKEGRWQYAGELWERFETDHFRVLAAPGQEKLAQQVIEYLPEVYEYVTTTLEYTPSGTMEIKLYTIPAAIVANTLLSLPQIGGWNEPGESLKVVASRGQAPAASTVAHEFTHFISFEMAGVSHSRMPWWLEEGIADYVGLHFRRPDQRLDQVRKWAETGELVAWDKISDFNNTPVELWKYVYPQGQIFVRFVTETYGIKSRNEWLRAMAKEMDLEQATQATFDKPFADLNIDFLNWLKS